MAIYKNREVSILGPNNMANTPETINISYKDGSRENVSVTGILFTEEEKKKLIKDFPSKYEDVRTATQADIDAVRAGVTPPSDPSYREMAQVQVQREKQDELTAKNVEAAKAEAKKNFDENQKRQSQPATQTVMNTPAPKKDK